MSSTKITNGGFWSTRTIKKRALSGPFRDRREALSIDDEQYADRQTRVGTGKWAHGRDGHEKGIVAAWLWQTLPCWVEVAATRGAWDGGPENPVLLKVDPVQTDKRSPSCVTTAQTNQDRRGVAPRDLHRNIPRGGMSPIESRNWEPGVRSLVPRATGGAGVFPTTVKTL